MLNPVPAQRARLLLAQGDLAAAARLDEETRPARRRRAATTRASPDTWYWPGCCWPRSRPAEALALLDRLHAAAAAQHRAGSLIEAGALRALALAAAGEDAAAVNALADVLDAGLPAGLRPGLRRRGTADGRAAGPADRGPAGRPGRRGVPLGCLARLQRAFDGAYHGPGHGRTVPAAVPGLVEQLTSRELEVLAMLAAGRSNQAIASQLVVTLDTVKKHVSHVLGKLGAANRTEAVARARELSLIP